MEVVGKIWWWLDAYSVGVYHNAAEKMSILSPGEKQIQINELFHECFTFTDD